MVEALAYCRRRNSLPSPRVVAGLASANESAAVRVAMAGVAGAERQAYIFRPAIGARHMAFLARHLLMHAGERIPGPAVIEPAQRPSHHLPIIKPMALLAILPESALVLITMAG